MKSGILSFNKGLFMQHTRSILWICVFFLLSQILLLPLGILIKLLDGQILQYLFEEEPRNILFTISYSIQYLSYIVFPVLSGIILTSYITKKGSSDFVHSLPFKRSTLLYHVYLAGTAALVLPIFINVVILLIIRPFVKPITYSAFQLFEWAGVSLFVVLFMFFVTVMIGLFIGPPLLKGIMVYGILMLPAGLLMMTLANARYFIDGLAAETYTSKIMADGFFLFRAGGYETRPFSGMEWGAYLAIAAVVVAVSFYVYKVRPAEAGDETIVFPFFRWAFIFVFTYVSMLIGGEYFGQFLSGSTAWMIAGYVIGALAGYTLLQMIVQRSLRLIWPLKGFAVYVLLLLLMLIPGTFIATSYEKAIPEANEIEKVYIGETAEPFENVFNGEGSAKFKKVDAGFMKGANSIAEVRDIHSKLIDRGKEKDYDSHTVTITYELKDGNRIQRQYNVPFEELVKITEPIRKNVEFIKASNPVFSIADPENITYISGYDGTTGIQLANVAEKKTITALMSALEKDALTREADMFSPYYYNSSTLEIWLGKQGMTFVSANVSLDDEQSIRAIRDYIPGAESFASVKNVEKAFVVTAKTEEQKEELIDFVFNEEGEEPEWEDMPIPFKEIKGEGEIAELLNPAGLTEESSRLLVLKWKYSGGVSFTVNGLKK
ncbi:hypothetical protein [Domibacillus epiphyticus]|uniref:Multidrug ABC transporter permease n=1 Tax=Domibacillus epiphyticus TaxID=1714355 RepID=A0A1V2A6S8_9BACI|nr:hypothetical protein [Domibacillus epiphyticus]OMP66676.1 hypothetical protein BTO28_11590 [Domibacillus epiphyticus]